MDNTEDKIILGLIKEAQPLSLKLWAAQVLTEHYREFNAQPGSERHLKFSEWADKARDLSKLADANGILIIALLDKRGMKKLRDDSAKDDFVDKYVTQVPRMTRAEESACLEELCGFKGTLQDFVIKYPSNELIR